MDDIAPEILESIKKTFNKALSTDSTIKRARTALKEGKATYNDANYLSQRYGELLSRSIQLNVSTDILPDGRMYYNIADKILRPLLEMDHDEIANYCADVQTRLNEISGVGLKGLKADLNRSKVDGFIDKVSSAEKYDDVKWTYISPAGDFQADGERSGKYILGGEELTLNSRGESILSYADYAIAMVDEIEKGDHIQQRISVVRE